MRTVKIFPGDFPSAALTRQHLGAPLKQVRFVTIHNTAEPFSAAAERLRVLNRRDGVVASFHYAVDENGAAAVVPEELQARHAGDGAGDGNTGSLGIEICRSAGGGRMTALYRRAEMQAAKLAAALLNKYRLTADQLRYHRDWSGKYCPHRILAGGREETFRRMTAAYAAGGVRLLTGLPPPPESEAALWLNSGPQGEPAWLDAGGGIYPTPLAAARAAAARGATALLVSCWLPLTPAEAAAYLRELQQTGLEITGFYLPFAAGRRPLTRPSLPISALNRRPSSGTSPADNR